MKPGDKFVYKDIDFICLDIIEGNCLAITAEYYCEIPFDTNICNDWRKSSIRRMLNNDFLDLLDKKDLVKQISDLTADNGDRSYGTCEDYITILSCDQYRKYKDLVLLFEEWMWTLTPWSCNAGYTNMVRIVNTIGNISYITSCYSYAVSPIVLFNKDTFDKINVGDEVWSSDGVNSRFVVTYVDDTLGRITGFNSTGSFSNRPMRFWTKTGRHFPEIEKIFNELNK